MRPPGNRKLEERKEKKKKGKVSASFVEWTVRKQNYTPFWGIGFLTLPFISPTRLAITDPKKERKKERKKHVPAANTTTRFYEVRVEKQPLLLGVGRLYK